MSEETNKKIPSIQEDSENCEKCFYNSKTCEYSTHGFLGTNLLPRDEEGKCNSLLIKEEEGQTV